MAFPAFPTFSAGYVSSPILEAFVLKASEVEAEFHRMMSEVREEFRGQISDLQAEFCRVNSATGEVAVPAVSLPSNESMRRRPGEVASDVLRCKEEKGPQGDTASENGKFLRCVGGSGGGERGGRKRRGEKGRRVPLICDNQVRHLNAAFCDKNRRRRTRVCRPGAGNKRVRVQLDTCLEDGTKPIVFLSAGE
ncbi:hypothetical protein E2C01_042997 [Portunus trituberculatus]|uniref:Uncharacterized protein n=1 Tax=Portunus trituberculatus TaxID=210409 RepID=A0A5B7FP21_PORTR|nr:hypothetical protein [Portunus trituberculatus]